MSRYAHFPQIFLYRMFQHSIFFFFYLVFVVKNSLYYSLHKNHKACTFLIGAAVRRSFICYWCSYWCMRIPRTTSSNSLFSYKECVVCVCKLLGGREGVMFAYGEGQRGWGIDGVCNCCLPVSHLGDFPSLAVPVTGGKRDWKS